MFVSLCFQQQHLLLLTSLWSLLMKHRFSWRYNFYFTFSKIVFCVSLDISLTVCVMNFFQRVSPLIRSLMWGNCWLWRWRHAISQTILYLMRLAFNFFFIVYWINILFHLCQTLHLLYWFNAVPLLG